MNFCNWTVAARWSLLSYREADRRAGEATGRELEEQSHQQRHGDQRRSIRTPIRRLVLGWIEADFRVQGRIF